MLLCFETQFSTDRYSSTIVKNGHACESVQVFSGIQAVQQLVRWAQAGRNFSQPIWIQCGEKIIWTGKMTARSRSFPRIEAEIDEAIRGLHS